MKYELWYSVVVRDRQGKVVSRERRKSRSFLEQWNRVIYIQIKGGGTITTTDTGGVARSVGKDVGNLLMAAAAGVTTHGIRVGTGNTAVAIDDYALDAPIDEGVGGDQMEHLICTIDTSVVAAPSCSFVVSRTITNNSPAEITVREAALYMEMGFPTYYGCATRDVLSVPQAVPIGGSITIDWTIQVTV